jgi:hypothetical protein
MNLDIVRHNLREFEISTSPFPHFTANDFFASDFWEQVVREIDCIENSEADNLFKSEFGVKSEWKNFPSEFPYINKMLDYLFSHDFIEKLKKSFGIAAEIELTPDRTFDGGGYVVSPPGSFLGYHADFNFSSKTDSYRILNVLVYANLNYVEHQGGHLHLLDPVSKTVEKVVKPTDNTFLAFAMVLVSIVEALIYTTMHKLQSALINQTTHIARFG